MIVLNLEENICKRKINYYRGDRQKIFKKNYEKILENIEGCRKNLIEIFLIKRPSRRKIEG